MKNKFNYFKLNKTIYSKILFISMGLMLIIYALCIFAGNSYKQEYIINDAIAMRAEYEELFTEASMNNNFIDNYELLKKLKACEEINENMFLGSFDDILLFVKLGKMKNLEKSNFYSNLMRFYLQQDNNKLEALLEYGSDGVNKHTVGYQIRKLILDSAYTENYFIWLAELFNIVGFPQIVICINSIWLELDLKNDRGRFFEPNLEEEDRKEDIFHFGNYASNVKMLRSNALIIYNYLCRKLKINLSDSSNPLVEFFKGLEHAVNGHINQINILVNYEMLGGKETAFKNISEIYNISSLCLFKYKEADCDLELLTRYFKFKTVKIVDLEKIEFLERLFSMNESSEKLTSFFLAGNFLLSDDESNSIFSKFKNLKTVCVDFEQNTCTKEVILLNIPITVEKLTLSHLNFNDSVLDVNKFTNLEELTLIDCTCSISDIDKLLSHINLEKLKIVSITTTKDIDFENLAIVKYKAEWNEKYNEGNLHCIYIQELSIAKQHSPLNYIPPFHKPFFCGQLQDFSNFIAQNYNQRTENPLQSSFYCFDLTFEGRELEIYNASVYFTNIRHCVIDCEITLHIIEFFEKFKNLGRLELLEDKTDGIFNFNRILRLNNIRATLLNLGIYNIKAFSQDDLESIYTLCNIKDLIIVGQLEYSCISEILSHNLKKTLIKLAMYAMTFDDSYIECMKVISNIQNLNYIYFTDCTFKIKFISTLLNDSNLQKTLELIYCKSDMEFYKEDFQALNSCDNLKQISLQIKYEQLDIFKELFEQKSKLGYLWITGIKDIEMFKNAIEKLVDDGDGSGFTIYNFTIENPTHEFLHSIREYFQNNATAEQMMHRKKITINNQTIDIFNSETNNSLNLNTQN